MNFGNNQINLQTSSILHVPFDKYEKNFRFIVNDQIFSTNHIVADILSREIAKTHFIDPTFNEITIKTKEKGDFSIFLNLLNFNQQEIPEVQVPFVSEIVQILGMNSIDIDFTHPNITINNVVDLIEAHQKNDIYFNKQLQKEIDFLSVNFYQIRENDIPKLLRLREEILESILSNPKLRLKTENQLLDIINYLYSMNNKFSIFYKYVYFSNVDLKTFDEFISQFDLNYLTSDIWHSFTSIIRDNCLKSKNRQIIVNRYGQPKENEYGIDLSKGVFNFLKEYSNLKDEVDVTCSSKNQFIKDPFVVLNYDNAKSYFCSDDISNSWICFEFKNHLFEPEKYCIRTTNYGRDCYHPKSWVIEGSSDKINWIVIDNKQNCKSLNKPNEFQQFMIKKCNKKFKFLRMRLTDVNWNYSNHLAIRFIDFFGNLT